MRQIGQESDELNDRLASQCSKHYFKGAVPKIDKDGENVNYLKRKH